MYSVHTIGRVSYLSKTVLYVIEPSCRHNFSSEMHAHPITTVLAEVVRYHHKFTGHCVNSPAFAICTKDVPQQGE